MRGLPLPQNPAQLAELFGKVAWLAIGAGLFMLYRALRRVNPADIIEGTVSSVYTDPNGGIQTIIEFVDRDGQKTKWKTKMDDHPGLGQIVPLVLPRNKKDPRLHVTNRIMTVIGGMVLIALGALLLVGMALYAQRES
ncbi:MAG: hypothetical protein QM760_13185 [Nibricoccus sp.]